MRSWIVVLSLVVLGCEKKSEQAPASPAASSSPSVKVEAKGKQVAIAVGEDGFVPNEVKVSKGDETSLVFTRTSEKTCATEVDFPELNVKKELPLNQPVAIVVPSGEARTLTFQCGMGMYKSKVLIQ